MCAKCHNLPGSAKRHSKNGESLFHAFMQRFWPHKEAGKSFFNDSLHKDSMNTNYLESLNLKRDPNDSGLWRYGNDL